MTQHLRVLASAVLTIVSILAVSVATPSQVEAQCVKCVSNKCSWGPWLNGKSDCDDWAPGVGCLASGTCGVTMTHIAPGGGVLERVVTQVVDKNGAAYLRACSGALIAVRMSPAAAAARNRSLSTIVI